MNNPKYKIGQKLLLIYGSKNWFKITGIFYDNEGSIYYSYRNWWGWGTTEKESRMEEKIIHKF